MFLARAQSKIIYFYHTLLATLLMGLLTVFLYQPKMSDDYLNHYLIIQGGGSYWKYLQYIYNHWSGRVPHTTLLWLAVTNETSRLLYQTTSFFALIGTLLVAAALPLGRFPRIFHSDMVYFWLIVAAIWFGNPAINETIFWTTGSTAYLIPVFCMLLFLLPYNWFVLGFPLIPTVSNKKLSIVGMFILGLIVGDYQEQVIFATGVLLTLWLLAILLQKRIAQVNPMYWAGFIGFLFGVMVCVLAPGNYVRLTTNFSVSPLQSLLYTSTYMIKYYFTPDLFVWLLAMLLLGWLISVSHAVVHESKHNRIRVWCACAYALASFLSLVPAFLTTHFFAPRTAFPAIVLLVISIAFLLTQLCSSQISLIHQNRATALCIIILFLLIFDTTKGLYTGLRINHALKQREFYIQEQIVNGEIDIHVPPLPSTKLSRLIYLEDSLKDPDHSINRQSITKIYGIHTLSVNENLQAIESKSFLKTHAQLIESREPIILPLSLEDQPGY